MNPALKERIIAIYREAEAEIATAGPKCDASGRCCRFKEYGHSLFISNLEAELLLESAPNYSKPVTSDGCPFQIENLCTAREPRPLGCRVYFCDPTYTETGNAITEKYLRKLKDLSLEFAMDWRYAPLHYFLNEADRPEFKNSVGHEEPSIRFPLKLV